MSIYVSRKAFIKFIIITTSVFIIIELMMGQTDTLVTGVLRFLCELLLIATIYYGVSDTELFNPMLLFSLTPLSLLIYSETVSQRYLNSLTVTTWIMGLANMFAFIWMVKYKTRSTYLQEINNLDHCNADSYDPQHKQLLIFHGAVLIVLGLIPEVLRLVLGTSFFLGSTVSYLLYAGIACAWKSKSKIFIAIAYILWLLSIISRFNKSVFLSIGLVTILSFQHLYAKDDKQKKQVYFGTVIAVVVMIIVAFPLKSFVQNGNQLTWAGISGAIVSYFQEGDMYYDTSIVFNGPDVLKLPYMYLVSAWNNVQYVVETQSTHTYGLWIIKPLLSWLQLDGMFSDAYVLKPYSSFNTFGYITVLYKDFGMWGSVIGSIILGWFVSKVYIKFRNSNSSFDVACYAMTAQATLEMFFSNHFFMLSYPFTIILVCWIYKLIFKSARYL